MILDFAKWNKLNEQQAAVNLTPAMYIPMGESAPSDGKVGYRIESDGGLSLHASNKKSGTYVYATIKPNEMTVESRKLSDPENKRVVPVTSYADTITKFLELAVDMSQGEFITKKWGEETAKLVNTLNGMDELNATVKNKLVITTKNNLFVLGGDPAAAIAKNFKAGVASILPSTSFAKA